VTSSKVGYSNIFISVVKLISPTCILDVAGALVGVGIICNSETNPGVLSLDKDYNNISKFLNRILGMPVDLQNRLFKYFTDTQAAIVGQAKKSGRYHMGILDLGTGQDDVKRKKLYTFTTRHAHAHLRS
jgi:C-terminal domain on Strawberry notch homologue